MTTTTVTRPALRPNALGQAAAPQAQVACTDGLGTGS